MKSIFTVFIALLYLLISSSFLVSAQAPCASEYPDEMLTVLENYKANNPGTSYQKSAASTLYVPVVAHIVGNDNGAGYYRSDHLLSSMCNINDQFSGVDMYFYLKDVNYINSTSLYEHTGNYFNVIDTTKYPNALNMYFVQDPNGACGYYSGWMDIIAINKSCGALDNSTIAHEIGHYMALPHTFFGWEDRNDNPVNRAARSTDERVNGSNCSSAGDRFCDTPADFYSKRWNCPYSEVKTDYNGDLYQPDGELYMSYANDACQNYFSNEQIDFMRYYLQNDNDRYGHLGYVPENFDSIGVPVTLFPLDTGNYKPPVNYIELKWKSVEGADFYSLMLTQGSNPNFFLFDTVLTDTSIILRSGLQPNFTYRWKVTAIHEGNTCSEYSDYTMFTASSAIDFEPHVNISPETCNRYDGAVDISVTGNGTFSYNWSNGASSNSLSGLEAGNYLVTITSSISGSLLVPVNIPYSGNINLNLKRIGFEKLEVEVEGGVGPFSYVWSDNSTESLVNLDDLGNYSVTVTDAFGCSVSESFNYTGINTAIDEVSFKLYPNPVDNNNVVNIEFNAKKQSGYTLQLIDVSGRVIKNENREMNSGLNKERFDISGVSQGIYILRISGKALNINRKIYVY
ncbi:MAG: T9SS type A sorting domain-containing protein [Chitinophagales bacterium]